MSRGNDNIHTIYDVMDKRGIFRQNPANLDAVDPISRKSLYKGPVQYPKMMYHPKGETRVVIPAEMVQTPFGPRYVGEQRELISRTVTSAEEEAELRADGWWNTPAQATYARTGEAPPVTSEERVLELEQTIAAMQAELKAAAEEKALRAELDQIKEEHGKAVPEGDGENALTHSKKSHGK